MDFDFPLQETAIFQDAGHKACRGAVLWPLTTRTGERPPIATAYARLLKAWRLRLVRLRKTGWGFVAGEERGLVNFTFARNCPPFGVAFGTRTPKGHRVRPCQKVRVCPWCYARQVVLEAYLATEFACYNVVTTPEERERLVLVGVRREYAAMRDPLEQLLDRAEKDSRWRLLRKLEEAKTPVFGYRGGVTIEPESGYTDRLHLRRSAIFVLPVGAAIDGLRDGHNMIKEKSVSKENIGRLASWCFPYPTGMLRGDPELTVKVLEATGEHRTKMTATWGACDNATLRDVVRKCLPREETRDDYAHAE